MMLRIFRLNSFSRFRRKIISKRNFTISNSRCQDDYGFTTYDRRPTQAVGYIVALPEIPEQSTENNLFLSNISRNSDWPPLATASAADFYEGTIKLLMEYGVTIHDHYQHIVEEHQKNRFGRFYLNFEQMLEPMLADEYDVDYAFNTLLLKMYTDWPACSSNDWKCDFYDVFSLRAHENRNKLTYGGVLYQWVKTHMDDFKKLKERTKFKGEVIENIEDVDKDLDAIMPYWQRRLVEYYYRHFVGCGVAMFHDGTEKNQLRMSKISQFMNKNKFDYM